MMTRVTETILTNNYLPVKPTFLTEDDRGNLDMTLKISNYNKILNNVDGYFLNVKIINFDLIHNQCRGDKLEMSKKHYETIYKKDSNESFLCDSHEETFISSAIKSDRSDVFIEKTLLFENIKRTSLKEKFAKKNIFLSSMDKQKKKYTDDFKILKF